MNTDRHNNSQELKHDLPIKFEDDDQAWPKEVDDFLLICGKPSKADDFWEIIIELRHSLFFQGRGALYPIVLIAPESMRREIKRWDKEETKLRHLYDWNSDPKSTIYIVFGTPRSRKTLQKAKVEKAQRALVLSDYRYFRGQNESDETTAYTEAGQYNKLIDLADEETVMTIFTLRDYYHEKTRKELPIGAELENSEHHANFIRLGVEDIVSTAAIEEKMLANALLSPSSSYLFLELVSFQENGTEIYREPIPSSWTKVTSFGALLHTMIQGGRIAIGVVRNTPHKIKGQTEEKRRATEEKEYASSSHELILFPKPSYKIKPGIDEALVIGYAKMKKEEFAEISPKSFSISVPIKNAIARSLSKVARFIKNHPRWSIFLLLFVVIYVLAGTPPPTEIISSAYNFIINVGQSLFCH